MALLGRALTLLFVLAHAEGCGSSTPPATTPIAPTEPTVSSAPSAPPAPPAKEEPAVKIPEGSGDYSAALADASAYKAKKITFEQLKQRVIARKLPPHPLGDAYLMSPVPAPPPGVKWDPLMMPTDWEHNFGEIAMTYFANQITRAEYDELHDAAHPGCGKTPPSKP